MKFKLNRRWFQFHLSTAILVMVLLAWSLGMILHTEYYPRRVLSIYCEYSWVSGQKPGQDWKEVGGVLMPPMEHIAELATNAVEAGYPWYWGEFYGPDLPNLLPCIFDDMLHYDIKGGPDHFFDRTMLLADVAFWLLVIASFAFVREWLLRRREARAETEASPLQAPWKLKFGRGTWGALIIASVLLSWLNLQERTECMARVGSVPPYHMVTYGEAAIRGRGWPFVFTFSSPIHVPVPTRPTVDVDTSLNSAALFADALAAILILFTVYTVALALTNRAPRT